MWKLSLLLVSLALTSQAQTALRSLKGVAIPQPAGLATYVRDRTALIALGKAFFWDMQAGSDGLTACATCHFHAGADHRPINTLVDPNNAFPLNADVRTLEFPFRLLADPANRNSAVVRDSSVRVGSAGTFRRIFESIVPGKPEENGHDELDKPEFLQGPVQVRRVTVRNSPSVYNTVFYSRSFWDGRAVSTFNGFTVTGLASEAPGVLVSNTDATSLSRLNVRLTNSSLASQAVGPILDHLEMSYEGRTWPQLARKLLSLRPLATQRVAGDDSVLGEMALTGEGEKGLKDEFSYRALIEAAFQPRFWNSTILVNEAGQVRDDGDVAQIEYNFPLFWGLSLQAYQSTLNSDDSPFDRFMDGDTEALTAQEQEGMRLFTGNARCNLCHNGPEFSAAALNPNGTTRGNNFERTGVRPVDEDLGSGGGAFKSIGLRNVEFTGPYFHNGGQATLEQVVDFYRRGGDFSPVSGEMRTLNISESDKAALVAFLKALSDDRVRYERAPFDHPELCVPVGHPEQSPGVVAPGFEAMFPASAAENWRLIPAAGAHGNPSPLRTFEEYLKGIGGNEGERAHSLADGCAAPWVSATP
jgi:cytochrome c peroxidase